MKKFAEILSFVFHPVLMLSYAISVIFFTPNYFSYFLSTPKKVLLLAIIVTFSVALPALNILLMKRFRIISSLYLSNPKERLFPYLSTAFFYFGLAYLFWDFSIPTVIKACIVTGGICILITALITLLFKVSAHMIGIGGLVGGLLFFSILFGFDARIILIMLLIIAGLIGTARLILNEHKPGEIYSGFSIGIFTGFSVMFSVLFLFK